MRPWDGTGTNFALFSEVTDRVELFLPPRKGRLTLGFFAPHPQKGVERARVKRQLAGIEVQGRCRRCVQQLAVVADQHETVPVTAQKAFQP